MTALLLVGYCTSRRSRGRWALLSTPSAVSVSGCDLVSALILGILLSGMPKASNGTEHNSSESGALMLLRQQIQQLQHSSGFSSAVYNTIEADHGPSEADRLAMVPVYQAVAQAVAQPHPQPQPQHTQAIHVTLKKRREREREKNASAVFLYISFLLFSLLYSSLLSSLLFSSLPFSSHTLSILCFLCDLITEGENQNLIGFFLVVFYFVSFFLSLFLCRSLFLSSLLQCYMDSLRVLRLRLRLWVWLCYSLIHRHHG